MNVPRKAQAEQKLSHPAKRAVQESTDKRAKAARTKDVTPRTFGTTEVGRAFALEYHLLRQWVERFSSAQSTMEAIERRRHQTQLAAQLKALVQKHSTLPKPADEIAVTAVRRLAESLEVQPNQRLRQGRKSSTSSARRGELIVHGTGCFWRPTDSWTPPIITSNATTRPLERFRFWC